jgi:radical SAM protein with 4Fe4S-binding SPASM domain
VRFTKDRGIDVSMTTNGVLFTKDISDKILKSLSWVRVSLNAGTAKAYAEVHRTRPEDFNRVLSNLSEAVNIKKKKKLNAIIGVQLLLLPENAKGVLVLAGALKKIGVDYLTIKPYSQHPLSGHRIDSKFKYEGFGYLEDELKKIENKNFKVIFRAETMARLSSGKDYRHCLGLPFWAYIDACGNVYACSAFLGKKEFCYGNIYQQDFKAIMNSKRRRDIVKKAALSLDVDHCRQVCRLDKINSYLWELKHPGPHVNFI